MNAANMLKTVLGFKQEAIVLFTDSDWMLAIQPGGTDKEIVGAGKVPATCFEFGFINKTNLNQFLAGTYGNKVELKVGEAYLSLEYIDGGIQVDYGRYIHNGELQIMDTKTITKSVDEFKVRLLDVLNKY